MPLRVLVSALVVAVALAGAAFAQTPPAAGQAAGPGPDEELHEVEAPTGLQDIDSILVAGRQPGPGLWKVRSGERTMWILGTQSPLPKRMQWDSSNVERRIAESQLLLMPPSVSVDADVGFLRGLTLLPSLFRARKNPDGKTLEEVVPPEQYVRWQALKKRYIGGDRGIEEWRPVFAALELYVKAIERSGMTESAVVSEAVAKAAKRAKVKIVTPTVKVKIVDAKAALRDFAKETLDDQACFRRTLDRIETDLDTMAGRANAWAQGDIEALRSLPSQNQFTACSDALTGNAIARRQGMHDIVARVENEWLLAAEKALSEQDTSFAVLPVSQLLRPNGLLERLIAKGYMVEEP